MSEPTDITQAGTPVVSAFGYFAIIPEELLASDLSDRAVRLWARFYRESDQNRSLRVRRKKLAEWMKVSTDSVDRAIKELEDARWISVERDENPRGDRSMPSLYTLTNPVGPPPHPRGGVGGNPAAQVGGTDAQGEGRTAAAQKPLEEGRLEVSPSTPVPPADAEETPGLTLIDDRQVEPDPIRSVFDAWCEARRETFGDSAGRRELTHQRRGLISTALKSWPLEELLLAAAGWRHFPHNRGENERGTRYDELDVVLRAKNVERFRDAEADASARPTAPVLSARDADVERKARRMQRAMGLDGVEAPTQIGAGGAA